MKDRELIDPKYPVPIGNGMIIIGFISFKATILLKITVVEVWRFDPSDKTFITVDFLFNTEIIAEKDEFFPVYEFTEYGAVIFMWEKDADLGVFVEISKDLFGMVIKRVGMIKQNMN